MTNKRYIDNVLNPVVVPLVQVLPRSTCQQNKGRMYVVRDVLAFLAGRNVPPCFLGRHVHRIISGSCIASHANDLLQLQFMSPGIVSKTYGLSYPRRTSRGSSSQYLAVLQSFWTPMDGGPTGYWSAVAILSLIAQSG